VRKRAAARQRSAGFGGPSAVGIEHEIARPVMRRDGEIAGRFLTLREVEMGIGVERIERENAVQARNGFFDFAALFQHISQVVPRIRESIVEVCSKPEVLFGFAHAPPLTQHVAKIEMRFSVLWIDCNGLLIRAKRFVQIADGFALETVFEPRFGVSVI
jgi:hypothetical protein